jgi:non-reducing end alpha-L-arabinofuranosidase
MSRSSSFSMAVALLALMGCMSDRSTATSASGGNASTGGAPASEGGSPGAGGSVGSGGKVGSGGDSGLGGTKSPESGGITGSGGKSAAGGAVAAGGKTGSGGTTISGAGGAAVSGGQIGSGGSPGTGGTTSSAGGTGGATSSAGGRGGTAGATAGTGGTAGSTAGTGGTAGSTGTPGPCDIYEAGKTPCVAAHSTVRALFSSYGGNLYQVRRASDKTTKDIPLLAPGGWVNASVQESFCTGTTCTVSYIYDQTSLKNDLPLSPPVHWLSKEKIIEAGIGPPGKGKTTVGGHTVYGIYVQPDGGGGGGNAYRNNNAKGLAKGDEPESMYWVVDGKYYNGRCCFDYGNVQTTGNDDGHATMETLNFSTIPDWSSGSGSGPWIMADLEDGVYAGALTKGAVASNTPIVALYVTGMIKGFSGNHYALKGGDAQSGKLSVKHDGARPPGWSPQKKQGAIGFGVGGDGSSGGCGIFFEAAITTGVSSDEVDDAVQANIVAAGYGK